MEKFILGGIMKKIIIGLIIELLICLSSCSSSNLNEIIQSDIISLSIKTETEYDNHDIIDCSIEYFFYSIADMETFINTGSKNVNDYSKAPEIKLEDMPKRDLSKRYMSLVSGLEIDEKQFTKHNASFQFTIGGKVEYRYYLDNSFITIKETDAASLEDYMSESYHNFKKMI